MLVALAPWLPQFAAEIPKAEERLLRHQKNGTRVKLKQGHGSARLHVKSVAEMSQEAEKNRKNAAAADKGNLIPAAA
jgi:alpha-galactosidase